MKTLPGGTHDFRKFIRNELYFVDKSPLIHRILTNKREAILVTRPRRFGKTLNLSMLDCYLNMKFAGNTWFDDLEISRLRPDDPDKNAYPVVHLNMGNVWGGNVAEFYSSLAMTIKDLFDDFPELSEPGACDNYEKEYRQFLDKSADHDTLEVSLKILTKILRKYHGKEVVVLIDEYDNPVNKADDSVRPTILTALRKLYTSALKDNSSLKFAMMTGILRIAKEDATSGLNNLDVYDLFSDEYDDMFGFTASEVEQLCTYYGRPEKFEEAKEWYDGYRFGSAEIYNPWSVLNYIKNGFQPKTYWGKTSGNAIITYALDRLDRKGIEILREMMSGETVETEVDITVMLNQMVDSKSTFSVLVSCGYLKVEYIDESVCRISIPNLEMQKVFREEIGGRFKETGFSERVLSFIESLEKNEPDEVSRVLTDILSDTVGVRVQEREYQMLLLGLITLMEGRYEITAERESGLGFYDIKMIGSDRTIIIETKVSDGDPDRAAEEAIRQIETKEYHRGAEGNVLAYGIAFGKQKAVVRSKMLGTL